MRFGLIEDYETRAEPLPIVMDDVFVNFDDTPGVNMFWIFLRGFCPKPAGDHSFLPRAFGGNLLEVWCKTG